MSAFKFDSTSFFLTYPQSGDLEWTDIADHLKSLKDIDWLRICKELHEDGQPHHHAVGKFKSRYQSRNSRCFDVKGKHPNIQSIRSIKRAIEYVSKDGEFHDIGTVPDGSGDDVDWLEIAKNSTEAEFYKHAMSKRLPFMYAKKFWDLGSKAPTHEIGLDYEPHPDAKECFELMLHQPVPGKSTVLIGDSGCGKSTWAKRVCEKPALWVRHLDVLRLFRKGYHKSIIFDEQTFLHLPRETQIQLVDQHDEAHIHVRYGYAIIPANVPKIFTANRQIFLDDPAINRRIHQITIYNPELI